MDLLLPQKGKCDVRSANILLKFLANYGIDHHSRAIARCLPKLVENKIGQVDNENGSLKTYLDSRLRQTTQCQSMNLLLKPHTREEEIDEPI